MSKEKQIEEMAHELCGMNSSCEVCRLDKLCLARNCADIFYNVGYRKQSEGEWVTKDLNNPLYESKKAPHCSNCEYMSFIRYDYCPNCGAKMKGGAE